MLVDFKNFFPSLTYIMNSVHIGVEWEMRVRGEPKAVYIGTEKHAAIIFLFIKVQKQTQFTCRATDSMRFDI